MAKGTLRKVIRSRLFIGAVALAVGGLAVIITQNLTPERRELRSPVAHAVGTSDPAFLRTLDGLYGTNMAPGNHIETLVNGDRIFPAMLEAIRGAQATISFETFVYWDGSIAEEFANALSERAEAGVEVRVLLDWQGSLPMEQRLIDQMRRSGVFLDRFRPVHWYTLDRINNRTHRKVLVVDGMVGFTGGVGIGDKWLGDARNPDEWRETHYRVTGPTVAGLQGAFADNWVEATGEVLKGPGWFPEQQPAGEKLAHVIISRAGNRNTMHLMLMTALAGAERNIRIGTPYFVPDEVAKNTLIEARARGVEVDVLVPGPHMDKQFVRNASRHFWGDLLEAGVRIHEYQPTMYHPKLVIVDDVWASIGSANFDERSFRLNDEANMNVFDPAFVQEQVRVFEADLQQSRLYTLTDWENRSLGQKFTDWVWSQLRVQL